MKNSEAIEEWREELRTDLSDRPATWQAAVATAASVAALDWALTAIDADEVHLKLNAVVVQQDDLIGDEVMTVAIDAWKQVLNWVVAEG